MTEEQLKLGHSAIVDAVNDHPLVRQQWIDLADRRRVSVQFIEVRCPDADLHRARLAPRSRGIVGCTELTWESVETRRAAFMPREYARRVLDSRGTVAIDVAIAISLNNGPLHSV